MGPGSPTPVLIQKVSLAAHTRGGGVSSTVSLGPVLSASSSEDCDSG